MKRMHIHIGVKDLAESVRFYSALFGAEPAKLKPDYAKWMLDDPHVNFAISTRSRKIGLDHLGLQVDDAGELNGLRDQMSAANIATHSDGETTCCYAKSEKSGVEDPNGVAWEAYHTMADAQLFAGGEETPQAACRTPEPKRVASASCCGGPA